jgi:hypothetical protein
MSRVGVGMGRNLREEEKVRQGGVHRPNSPLNARIHLESRARGGGERLLGLLGGDYDCCCFLMVHWRELDSLRGRRRGNPPYSIFILVVVVY